MTTYIIRKIPRTADLLWTGYAVFLVLPYGTEWPINWTWTLRGARRLVRNHARRATACEVERLEFPAAPAQKVP